ncbi:MAG: hemolysin family protein [Ignavibacteriaceae bacterium]|jgi:CBS domain containing-hemolysin-like protein|nr:hemolysin family protein [Ignavibacteriaceae bacterium]
MITDILITGFLVFLNGFFVAAEFAIVKVRASQLELKALKGNRFAILGSHIISHLDAYLAATQLGITLASLGLGWIGEPVVSKIILTIMHATGIEMRPEMAHMIALPVAFITITALHIIFGELAPKTMAIQHSEATTLAIVYPLHFFHQMFKPFIWLLNGIANFLLRKIGISKPHGSESHSSEEIKYLVQQGRESGTIENENYTIIKNAFEFSERAAKQIMIPRHRVLAFDVDMFDENVLEKILEENYSRIPFYEDSLDNIVGIVYLKDLLLNIRRKSTVSIRELMRPVMYVPESKRIGQLLREFQLKHQQIAVVVSEYGGTEGIITMEDILEELVGEIQDEHDAEKGTVERIDEANYSVLCSTSIIDANHYLPHPIEEDKRYETVAGYLFDKFGRIPHTNEKIISDDYEFTILKKSRNSIILVLLRDLLKNPGE